MALIPLNKRYSPDFKLPGKPVGAVEIDPNNHFVKRGLKHFFMLRRGEFRDIVSGASGVNNGVDFVGPDADFDGGSDYISFPNDDLWLPTDSSKISIAWRMDIDSVVGSFNGIMTPAHGFGGTTNNNIFLSSDSSYYPITMRHLAGTAAVQFTDSVLGTSATGDHFWGITWNGTIDAGNYTGYKDHLSAACEASGGTSPVTETSIGRYGAGSEIDGRLFYIAVWHGAELSAGEMERFRLDPYQVLRPKVPLHLFSAEAGVGVTLGTPVVTDLAQTSVTIGCTTDTAGGTLSWYVSQSATAPSAVDLKAGTGADQFGNFVPSLGANTVGVTSLAGGTGYYHYWIQETV